MSDSLKSHFYLCRYAESDYWRARYAACKPGDTFEWFLSYLDLEPLLQPWLRSSASVLDIGCGASQLLADMRAAGHRGRLVGVDVASEAFAVVRDTAAAADIELVVADARALPRAAFPDASFDAVIDKGTVDALITGEYADVTAIVREATRVLRPGGRFVVCSHHAPDLEDDDDSWLNTVLEGLANGANWKLAAHTLAIEAPSVYIFSKCRSTRGAGRLEMEVISHGGDSDSDR